MKHLSQPEQYDHGNYTATVPRVENFSAPNENQLTQQVEFAPQVLSFS